MVRICLLTSTCQNLQMVCINIMHFAPLVQNPSKVSVKDRLGFSAKPAAPFEKVSVQQCLFFFKNWFQFFFSFKFY